MFPLQGFRSLFRKAKSRVPNQGRQSPRQQSNRRESCTSLARIPEPENIRSQYWEFGNGQPVATWSWRDQKSREALRFCDCLDPPPPPFSTLTRAFSMSSRRIDAVINSKIFAVHHGVADSVAAKLRCHHRRGLLSHKEIARVAACERFCRFVLKKRGLFSARPNLAFCYACCSKAGVAI